MAKKTIDSSKKSSEVNVSEEIRKYLQEHKNAGPTEAAAEISKQIGKEIPPSYVSNIKNLMAKKSGKRRVKATARRTAGASKTTFRFDQLDSVKSLVSEIGRDGVEKLMDAVS